MRFAYISCLTLYATSIEAVVIGLNTERQFPVTNSRKPCGEARWLHDDHQHQQIFAQDGKLQARPLGRISPLTLAEEKASGESQNDTECESSPIIWHPPLDDKKFKFYPSVDTPGWPFVPDSRKVTYLTLVNGSPYSFNVTKKTARQMSVFDLDDVAAGESRQYVQQYQSPSFFRRWGNTKGTATYEIDCDDCVKKSFQVEATTSGKQMAEKFSLDISANADANSNTITTSVELNQRGGSRAYNLIISGSDKLKRYYTSIGTPVAWMHDILDVIGERKLKHICMLGSHDAGMSKVNGSTAFVDWRNTKTQGFNVYGQLMAGSRYLDIRPVIANGGQYMTGHYNLPSDTPLGGNGQTLEEIVTNINDFTKDNPELVILRLTHAYNTDDGYRPMKDSEFEGAFDILEGLTHRCGGLEGDITDMKLNDLIGDGRACVIVVTSGGIARPEKGVYGESRAFPVLDNWSDTDSVSKMASDQLAFLSKNRHLSFKSTKDTFLIFQWLLTLQAFENISVSDWMSIESLAVRLAYDPLFWKAWNAFTPEMYPSVILMDHIGILQQGEKHESDDVGQAGRLGGNEIRALMIAINLAIASRNCFVGGGSIY